ncbi:MAG: hypothetical protein ABWW65_02390 [Thermoprotei archaeon]
MLRVAIIGFGNVGRSLLLELDRIRDVEVKLAVSSRGYVVVRDQRSYDELLKLARAGTNLALHSGFEEERFTPDIAGEHDIDLAFISIPPNYSTGEPNRSIYYGLVDQGISIITADKTVLALEYRDFMEYAWRHRVFVGYRATVAAGIPVTDVAHALRNRGVTGVRGILNATTNYILSLMEKGLSYREAVEKAIMDKYAEPNPQIDTHGYDPAAKLAIILNILGVPVRLSDISREPLENISEEAVRKAIERNRRIRYVAEADLENRVFSVKPLELEALSRLANLPPTHNRVEFYLENDTIALEGPAGPAWRTARVMITDLLDYISWRNTKRH